MEKISLKEKIIEVQDFKEAISKIRDRIKRQSILIIDIDGVLVDIDAKILLQGLKFFISSKEKFEDFCRKHKIPIDYLLMIRRIIQKGAGVILFTNRIKSKDKNHFPFIAQETIEKFERKNIPVIFYQKFLAILPFLQKLPEELLNKIKDRKEIFYIGSGKIDKIMFKKLARQFKDKKFEYIQVGSKDRLI
jgi:hypothetical protein